MAQVNLESDFITLHAFSLLFRQVEMINRKVCYFMVKESVYRTELPYTD